MALRTPRKPPRPAPVAVDPDVDSDDDEHPNIPGVHWLTPMEAWTDYDAYTKRYLGMSGEEFGVRWDRGEFNDEFEFPDSIGASMMRCEKPAEADAREHDAG